MTTNARDKVYSEIKETFGLVPEMFKIIPDTSIEPEWQSFKRTQLEPGAIPNKYRELIGLALAAEMKCKYCLFYHTELAKLNGATDAEIEETVRVAKSVVGWSAYISGNQLDFDKFKSEVKQACDHVRSKQGKKK